MRVTKFGNSSYCHACQQTVEVNWKLCAYCGISLTMIPCGFCGVLMDFAGNQCKNCQEKSCYSPTARMWISQKIPYEMECGDLLSEAVDKYPVQRPIHRSVLSRGMYIPTLGNPESSEEGQMPQILESTTTIYVEDQYSQDEENIENAPNLDSCGFCKSKLEKGWSHCVNCGERIFYCEQSARISFYLEATIYLSGFRRPLTGEDLFPYVEVPIEWQLTSE